MESGRQMLSECYRRQVLRNANRQEWASVPTERVGVVRQRVIELGPEPAVRQAELAHQIREASLGPCSRVAAVDVAYRDRWAFAAAVVVVEGRLVEHQLLTLECADEYQPGLFAAREVECASRALELLREPVEALMVDGHGRAHPRRFGLACQLGLSFEIPTVGVAKQSMLGEFALPQPERGCWSPVLDHSQVVGAALVTRSGVKPLFVSVGHLCDLEGAIALTLAHSTFRFPEPQRWAHHYSIELRAGRV